MNNAAARILQARFGHKLQTALWEKIRPHAEAAAHHHWAMLGAERAFHQRRYVAHAYHVCRLLQLAGVNIPQTDWEALMSAELPVVASHPLSELLAACGGPGGPLKDGQAHPLDSAIMIGIYSS